MGPSTHVRQRPGMIRRMNPSKRGTVNPVSPWAGLQTIPFEISLLRTGAIEVTVRPSSLAISPERCGPAPNSCSTGWAGWGGELEPRWIATAQSNASNASAGVIAGMGECLKSRAFLVTT